MDSPQMTCDVLVVGGGPGGIAAACAAAEAGRRVALVDNAPALGGNIWRGGAGGEAARQWIERLGQARVDVLHEAAVFQGKAVGAGEIGQRISVETPGGVREITSRRLILATGARELFLPFPGWTLPNVMGVGGLQAMVKQGLPMAGKKVVIAGSGPLLLAVAVGVRKAGGKVVAIAEQTSRGALLRFAAGLMFKSPSKMLQAAGLQFKLLGVPYWDSCWVAAARAGKDGRGGVTQVTLADGSNTWTKDCDYLACAYGLIPSIELPLLLGCEAPGGKVTVNAQQESSIPGVYCVGETVGIGGVDCAIIEGGYAGLAAASALGGMTPDLAAKMASAGRARRKARHFAAMLDRTFALRPEVKKLATEQTIVCRCEDVTRGQLDACTDWRAAKLHTRCGMGPCQGRICGGAVEALYGWQNVANRPPVLPVRVESLAGAANTSVP